MEELASILQDLLLRQLAEAGHGDHGNKVKQDIGSSNSIPGRQKVMTLATPSRKGSTPC